MKIKLTKCYMWRLPVLATMQFYKGILNFKYGMKCVNKYWKGVITMDGWSLIHSAISITITMFFQLFHNGSLRWYPKSLNSKRIYMNITLTPGGLTQTNKAKSSDPAPPMFKYFISHKFQTTNAAIWLPLLSRPPHKTQPYFIPAEKQTKTPKQEWLLHNLIYSNTLHITNALQLSMYN